jgi:hypothetical protein
VLGWRHTTPLHLQKAYYIQWQNEVEQQFSGEGRHDIVILRNRRNL